MSTPTAYVAKHKYAPVSARKARLVIDLVRRKSVDAALSILRSQPQKSARFLEKVIKSAAANAEDRGEENVDRLVVARAFVDESIMIPRMRPRARGSAGRIRKRRCHICIELMVE